MSGTVNISRALWDDDAFAAAPFSEREAWIWMIAEASWKARTKRVGDYVVSLERGQLAASVRFMAKAFDWTPAKVQRYLKRLEKLSLIATKSDTGVTVITLCNYEKHQSGGQAADTAPIQERYTSDTNEKKGEIREKEGGSNEPPVRAQVREHFPAFWAAYPHRQGKKTKRDEAEKAFAKALGGGATVAEIAAGVEALRRDPDTARGYQRGPVPWLNQRGWLDEIPENLSPFPGEANGQSPRRTSPDRREDRTDPALEQIARLA